MDTAKYSELQDRLSDVERDLKAFIIETIKEYGGRISLNLSEEQEDDDNFYPVTSTLYGKNDYPLIRISDVYLSDTDSICADGQDSDTGENRTGFSIHSEQLADIFHFIGEATEQNTEITKVVFRKQNEDGDIVAIFPEMPATIELDTMMSYAHIGQHSAACYDWVKESTVPATEGEYADLLNELKRIGYTAIEIISDYKPQFN